MTLTAGPVGDDQHGPVGSGGVRPVGADRSAELTAVDFAEIPPGEVVPLTITMSGTGSVDVSIVPALLPRGRLMSDLSIEIHDKTLHRVGWVNDPVSLTVTPRHNNIGSR
jgi:hypothetical protein